MFAAGTKILVTIQDDKTTRNAKQHGLKWMWMGIMEKQEKTQGKTAEEWNDEYKGRFMPGILAADDAEWAEFFTIQGRLMKDMTEQEREIVRNHNRKLLHTELMDVHQMYDFMTKVQRDAAITWAVSLPDKNDLMAAEAAKRAA
ncbi:MAG: hypothetical protein HKP56_05270 [Anderseniella sp.]|nr:hypothetical protein [Anderseniella sp.]